MSQDKPDPSAAAEPSAAFGFDDIPARDKPERVRALFSDVAGRYDLMNDLMSAGLHRLWKAALLEAIDPRPGQRILDVAGGTGDVALRLAEPRPGKVPPEVVVCDLTEDMVALGRDRAIDRGILSGILWVCGDAEALPLADRSVDAYSVAFGLRNVTRLSRAAAEARRVLRPGGRFVCLEFSRVALPLLSGLYDRYSFSVLPLLGGLVAGNRDAYRYLAESIRRFPDQQSFAGLLEEAGLERVRYRNLSGGIVALHSAWRL